MPTILRMGAYRFYFYSHDLIHEPPHVHVDHENDSAKFWLKPVALARNLGYNANQLRRIERIIRLHQSAMLERWYMEYEQLSR